MPRSSIRRPHAFKNLSIRGRSGYPRSVPDPLSWTTRAPSEGNATAKQGCERRPPIAYNLPLGACTLTHAFESCPTWTQPTSLKHGCSTVAQHRVSCRWSTPQRKTEKLGRRTLQKSEGGHRNVKHQPPCAFVPSVEGWAGELYRLRPSASHSFRITLPS